MKNATFSHCKETYSGWSDDFLLKAYAEFERLNSDAQAALKDVMSSREIWPSTDESNPNWPSKTGEPSGKYRGNNPPGGI